MHKEEYPWNLSSIVMGGYEYIAEQEAPREAKGARLRRQGIELKGMGAKGYIVRGIYSCTGGGMVAFCKL